MSLFCLLKWKQIFCFKYTLIYDKMFNIEELDKITSSLKQNFIIIAPLKCTKDTQSIAHLHHPILEIVPSMTSWRIALMNCSMCLARIRALCIKSSGWCNCFRVQRRTARALGAWCSNMWALLHLCHDDSIKWQFLSDTCEQATHRFRQKPPQPKQFTLWLSGSIINVQVI